MEKGTAYAVISADTEVSEICESILLDDDYSLCIFATPYDEIGVAYLKNQGENKYSYCMSYTATAEMFLEQDSGYYLNASGNSPKVYFDITDDKALIPKGSSVTEFMYNNQTYYFYIFKTETRYHFFNASGVNY